MAPKGKGKQKGKGSSKKTENRAQEPNCIFKPEIISNILSRLPLKTLLQFRSVCKQWRKLIYKPDFIVTHYRHSSSLQRTDSSMIIIQSRHDGRFNHNVLVQYKPPLPPVQVKNPYPIVFPKMSIAGPVNGILCIFQPPLGDALTLWNPAMNKSKMVMLSKTTNPSQKVSVGLAFDSQKKDLLILKIFCVPPFPGCTKTKVEFEIREMKYPLGWEKLKSRTNYFYIDKPSCDAIFKAEPYWLAYDYEEYIPGKYQRLVHFEVSKMDFEWWILPFIGVGDYYANLANFEDSLGFMVWTKTENSYIDVWEVDDKKFQWRKKCKIGPLSGFDRILGCLRNGEIVAENEEGVLLFYTVNKSELAVQNDENLYPCSVKNTLTVGNSEKGSHVIFDCPESLLLIEGMVTVDPQDVLKWQSILSTNEDFIRQL
ncbi:putative F-box/LRR-repeat/kelch-repeat protein [Capsicum galapagoense]